ncbi:hypothetical protein HDU88_005594 [Geranomyces variabilis]|nr:hypothetical protein HDU88_005594 [Geranomyces variabilis]
MVNLRLIISDQESQNVAGHINLTLLKNISIQDASASQTVQIPATSETATSLAALLLALFAVRDLFRKPCDQALASIDLTLKEGAAALPVIPCIAASGEWSEKPADTATMTQSFERMVRRINLDDEKITLYSNRKGVARATLKHADLTGVKRVLSHGPNTATALNHYITSDVSDVNLGECWGSAAAGLANVDTVQNSVYANRAATVPPAPTKEQISAEFAKSDVLKQMQEELTRPALTAEDRADLTSRLKTEKAMIRAALTQNIAKEFFENVRVYLSLTPRPCLLMWTYLLERQAVVADTRNLAEFVAEVVEHCGMGHRKQVPLSASPANTLYVCDECQAVLTTAYNLQAHKTSKHNEEAARKYPCPTCGFGFKSKQSRTRHLPKCTGQPPAKRNRKV